MKHPAHRVLSIILVGLTFVFFAQILSPDGLSDWRTVPDEIGKLGSHLLKGELTAADGMRAATLVSGPLMHANLEHILYNLLFLWIFAGVVGELLGVRWLLILFFVTAVAGAIGDTILRPDSRIPSLGISGAVMGFEGAYLGLAVRWRLPDPEIWPIAYPIPPMRLALLAVAGVALDLGGVVSQQSGTAYGAHLGGFITGLFLTCFIVRRPQGLPA